MLKKEIKFLASHSAIYGLGTLVSQLVGFLLLPLYTRYLTPEDYGVLELVTITNSVVGILLSFGVSSAIIRFYYTEDNQAYRNTVISTSSIIYIVSALVGSSFLFSLCDLLSRLIFKSEGYSDLLMVSFSYLLIGGFNYIGDTYFRVNKKPVLYVTISITRLICLITLNIYFVVYSKKGVIGVLYSNLIVNSLSSLTIMIPILFKTGLGFKPDLAKEILRFSIPLIPSNIIQVVINQSDRFFITSLLSLTETGIFGLAVKLGNALLTLVSYPFNMAYMQRRFEIVNQENSKEMFSKLFTYFSFLLCGLGLGMAVFADDIIKLMTAPDYYKAGVLVPYVLLYCIVFSFRFHFDFGILWSKKTYWNTYISIAILVISLLSNYFFIKYMGMMGAVYAKCIVTTIHTFLIYVVSQKLYKVEYEFRRVFLAFTIGVLFFIISQTIHWNDLILNLLFKGIIVLFYPVALGLLRVVTKEESDKAREIVSDLYNKIKPFKSRIR